MDWLRVQLILVNRKLYRLDITVVKAFIYKSHWKFSKKKGYLFTTRGEVMKINNLWVM